jgi:exonuclease III
MMLSSELADGVRWAFIDRNARKGHKPSDHAPQFVDVL